jgi:hypothetical protein
MPQGIVKPSNQVVAFGDPLAVEMEIGANATAAKMLPGRVVVFDDADQTVKEAGAKAQVWMGVLDVAPNKKTTDAYAVADPVMVIEGECYLLLTLLANENVTRGDKLVTAADGKAAKLAVGALGSQGSIIGETLETSNVASDVEILVHWNPSSEPAAVA